MILGSIYVTSGAIILGVPVALFTSVLWQDTVRKKIYPFLQSAINLLAGVPSVVYGFFGLIVIVPHDPQDIGEGWEYDAGGLRTAGHR